MSRIIHKHPLNPRATVIALPEGFKLLSVGLDPSDALCLWVEIDVVDALAQDGPPAVYNKVVIHVIGTGHQRDDLGDLTFLGTVRQGPFMWHVYSEGKL